jgi:hypothetical protein
MKKFIVFIAAAAALLTSCCNNCSTIKYGEQVVIDEATMMDKIKGGWYGNGNGFILCETEVNRNGSVTYPKTLFSGTFTDIRLQISNLRSNAAREL